MYRHTDLKNTLFPIEVVLRDYNEFGYVTKMHWHEHIDRSSCFDLPVEDILDAV